VGPFSANRRLELAVTVTGMRNPTLRNQSYTLILDGDRTGNTVFRSAELTVAVLTLTLVGALQGCAAYRKCGLGGCPGDARITAEVTQLFQQYPELEPPNLIYVQTLDRVVYLTGQVNTDPERALAKSVALRAAGVRQVVNSINLSYQGR
jgi:osmotically-inducible protein OsmY